MHCRFHNSIRILLQTAFTVDGWSHEWELKHFTFGGGTRVLRVLAVFRPVGIASTGTRVLQSTGGISRVYAASTRNIYGFNTLDTLGYSNRFGCLCCGYCLLYSGFCTVAVLTVFAPSLLVLLILTARAVFRTSQTRVLQYTQHQQYPEYRTPQYRQHRQPQKKSIEHHTYEHVSCSTDTPTYNSTSSVP